MSEIKLCECGCGLPTLIARRNEGASIKGTPLRFIKGHQMRTAEVRSRRVYHTIPFAERFWAKVRKTDTCWLWSAHTSSNGYGTTHREGHTKYAHRLAWEMERGSIPAGMEVCHRCDNPPCVRAECAVPGCLHAMDSLTCTSHLFLGTAKDNARDMVRKGRAPYAPRCLTLTLAREIRALRAMGTPAEILGLKFGVTPDHIRGILHNKYWRE